MAIDDLAGIALWIADRADSDVAHSYVERLRAFVLRLGSYPRRGTPRDDFAPGLRSVTFERRYVILYAVNHETVKIMRIVSGSRDLRTALGRLATLD